MQVLLQSIICQSILHLVLNLCSVEKLWDQNVRIIKPQTFMTLKIRKTPFIAILKENYLTFQF